MQANGESIYGSTPDPFPYDLPWGVMTMKPGELYLGCGINPSLVGPTFNR